jgi:hypothetical protein
MGTIDRIGSGHGHAGNVVVSLGTFSCFAIAYIPMLAAGIRTNDTKVATGSDILMCDASRNDDDIARL